LELERADAVSELPASLFVSDELHAREVVLFDGSTHLFHFREFTAAEYREVQRLARSDDEADQDAHRSQLVAISLRSADGSVVLTAERAAQLKPSVRDRLYITALQVNGYGQAGAVGNALQPGATTGSGTSSPSHSAGEPSGSGNA
jgi:hypothetical protein